MGGLVKRCHVDTKWMTLAAALIVATSLHASALLVLWLVSSVSVVPVKPSIAVATPRGEHDLSDAAYREDFVRYMRARCADPTGLTILEWGPREGLYRHVRIRCTSILGPVAEDEVIIEYRGESIANVYVPKIEGRL